MTADALVERRRGALPAFGRELLELRRRGYVPKTEHVHVALDNWNWARARPWRLVVPTDADPEGLDWALVAALDVWLLWSPIVTRLDRRDAVLRGIMRAAPRQLWVLDMVEPGSSFFVVSRLHGVMRPEYLR